MKVQRFWVQGYWVQRFKVQRFWVQRFKVQRFYVLGSGFWVQGSEVLGSRVWGFDPTRKVRPSRWLEKGVVKAIK
jgi:hypothetical protein